MKQYSAVTLGIIFFCLSACDNDIIDLKDERHVRVYQDDKAIACQDTGQISLATHGKLLVDKNIEIHCSQKGHDGMNYTESCGSETGSINIFTIHAKDLHTAESLGFSQLSDLPDAQLDKQCEFKVISDVRKYGLINQLRDQYATWKAKKAPDYQFEFNMNFSDCPSFAPTPNVKITVSNNAIDTVYDLDNETFLTNINHYMTIDELFKTLHLQLELTPIEAGLHANTPKLAPVFHNLGAPKQYFIDSGGKDCDAVNYAISHIILPEN
ncbi:DUF6174 domain-containing protein [Colwellia sp. UCD-KL20]|uniref:DUF6174 domain-containing protein n=1 Tax=Colwellia sp. UCD-KL20 TaxID=1917165 RepID=UPI000970D8FC|nr:DUF6174 domain-containing protein [Colwellia sp. UCD-KL20]